MPGPLARSPGGGLGHLPPARAHPPRDRARCCGAVPNRWAPRRGHTGVRAGRYMGKAHAVAMSAVGAVFETTLRPYLRAVAASSPASAERYRKAFGFERAADGWEDLVADEHVGAVIIASPQEQVRPAQPSRRPPPATAKRVCV